MKTLPKTALAREGKRWLKDFRARTSMSLTRLRGGRIIHLLHIGKTGGNAIRNGLGLNKQHIMSFPGGLVIQHPHETTLPMCPAGECVTFVVRDPMSRFVSGFWSRFRKGRDGRNAWSAEEAEAFARFQTPDALGRALSDSDPEIRATAERAMTEIEHVRDKLVHYLISPDYVYSRHADILDIGFIGNLSQYFDNLTLCLNTNNVPGLPTDTYFAHRTPESFPKELSWEAAENLRSWYAEDIEIYDACCELSGRDSGTPLSAHA